MQMSLHAFDENLNLHIGALTVFGRYMLWCFYVSFLQFHDRAN